MRVAIACDHAGFEGRKAAIQAIEDLNFEALDLGPKEGDSVDYPDFAHVVATAVSEGKADFGVLICGTGQGMAMSANRHPKIRAAVLTDEMTTTMAREHNNANIACFGERVIGAAEIARLLSLFLKSAFEGGRHQRRVDKIEV